MGLLDSLFSGDGSGGGLLDFLRGPQYPAGTDPMTADNAYYSDPNRRDSRGYPPAGYRDPRVSVNMQYLGTNSPVAENNQPSPLDNAQWPYGPNGGPSALDNAQWPSGPVGAPANFADRFNAMPGAPQPFQGAGRSFDTATFDPSTYAPNQAQPISVGNYQMPRMGTADQFTPAMNAMAQIPQNAQGGGLLDFLRTSQMQQQQYQPGAGFQDQQPSPLDNAQWPYGPNGGPSPLDTAQWPAGPVGAPPSASAPNQAQPIAVGNNYQMPRLGSADQFTPAMNAQAQIPPNAQPTQGQLPPQQPAMQAPQQQTAPTFLSNGGGFGAGLRGFVNNLHTGPLGAIVGGLGSAAGMQNPAQQNLKAQYDALVPLMGPQKALLAVMNPDAGKALFEQFKTKEPQSLGQGWVLPHGATKAVRLYEPDEKTPNSVREYEFYKENLPAGQKPMDYDLWSTAKARAGATNIANNIDMNSGQTYDKQLAEGLGKAHASLANGVEDAQTRARDIAAMQGAVDAIQKNGGTTGGLGQQQILDLKKTINAGMTGLGVDKPFNESDLSDKEFLTKFNRSMAGAQAKNAVGSRVTNFEMSNFLKANPGLDMSITGNQRLLGIQAQMEERNIAVGNSIRDATAEAISQGKKINPVEVQKIIKNYDDEHHIKDVVTGQDLTQSYALPEFQKGETNASMAKSHDENLKTMEKTIGGVTYEQRNGQWYPKKK